MSQHTWISWADHTFNPWWGCAKVSAGCAHCYAETLANRFYPGLWGTDAPRRPAEEQYWREPLAWNRKARRDGVRRRVFCASMGDVFEDRPDLRRPRAKLWTLIRRTPHLDWLLLTKRPENLTALLPEGWGEGWENVWLGVTAENQQTAEERIPILLETPARVRFASCEPLLGPVDLTWLRLSGLTFRSPERPWEPWLLIPGDRLDALRGEIVSPRTTCCVADDLPVLDWVIVGGESGGQAWPMHPDWARGLRDQCRKADTPFFFKQWGRWVPVEEESHLTEPRPLRPRERWVSRETDREVCRMRVSAKRAPGQDRLDGTQWHEFPEAVSRNSSRDPEDPDTPEV